MLFQFLRLSLISGLVFIASFLLILLVLAWVYQERIKNLMIAHLNENLQTEILVDDISLNLIRSFPLASLSFSNLKVMEAGNHHPKDTLLNARRLYLQFSLWDLARKKYIIKQLELDNASIKAAITKEGHPNYLFWETPAEAGEEESSLSFNIQRIILNNTYFSYRDDEKGLLINIDAERGSMRGLFSQRTYSLQAKGDFFARELMIGSSSIITNKPVKLDVGLIVSDQKEFTFEKGDLSINNHGLRVEGSIINLDEGVQFDTRLSGRDLQLHHLINDLPETWKKYTEGYRSKGELIFNASIIGVLNPSGNPRINADFHISNAELTHPGSGLKLKGLQFKGAFDNGSRRDRSTTSLFFENFLTKISDGELNGNFSISNLDNPNLNIDMTANLDAGDFVKLLRMDTITRAEGRLNMQVQFRGSMSEKNRFSTQDLLAAKASGYLQASDVAFRIKNDPLVYENFNGRFMMQNNNLVIEEFTGNASNSDFDIAGHFRNVLPYLLVENEKIFVDANLRAQNIDFDELLQENTGEADTVYRLSFSDRLGFNLEANIVNLKFRRFEAQHVMGSVSLQNKQFFAEEVAFRAMDGHIRASGYIDGRQGKTMTFGCNAHLRDVDIHKLFYQMGNFGQESIVADNIFGTVTSDFQFSAQWSPTLEVDWSTLETTANLKVENGALVEYEPMLALSRFLRVEGDLNHVTFSTLENQIRIKNRNIIIPDMEINSSALNLKLSGEHSFENEINYRMQILLSEILARKARDRRNPQEQYGDIIDDGLGRTTLFLLVTGTTDNPDFSYDYQGVREKLREDLREERQNLREVFRKEFGLFSGEEKDTLTEPTPRQKEMQRIQKQEEGEFIIEWEEEDF